jgi:ATP-dependent DNA ligase
MAKKELPALRNVEPGFIEPMYATAVRELPDGDAWAYEAKLDEYRCLACRRKEGVVLWSRRGNLFTTRFPENGGYTPGNPFDALIVGCYEGSTLKFVSKVRNGFVPHVRREVFKRFAGFATEKCPFTNLPEKRHTMWALTANEMKECRWLKRELVAQVEFTEWTPDGHLRHSSFVGLRDDKDPRKVVRE